MHLKIQSNRLNTNRTKLHQGTFLYQGITYALRNELNLIKTGNLHEIFRYLNEIVLPYLSIGS